MKRELPRVATWLLDAFAGVTNHESMAGDIAERYRAGRSHFWYWRQVLAVITRSVATELRTHTWLAIRALVVGWGVVIITSAIQRLLLHWLRGNPRGTGLLPASWSTVQWMYVRGWIVPPAVAYVWVLFDCLLVFGIGWLIGRLNRPHGVKLVLVFVASWSVLFGIGFFIFLGKTLQDWSVPYWRYDNPYFLAFAVAANIACMLSTMAGGLLSAAQAADDSATH